MEEELTIVVAAVSAYLGLPPERIDLTEVSDDNIIPTMVSQSVKQFRPSNRRLWKWSLTTAYKNDLRHIKINLKHGLSTWRQASV